jgi:hypothetical protein
MNHPGRCDGCAQPLLPDARFCPHCGRPFPPPPPRPPTPPRLATPASPPSASGSSRIALLLLGALGLIVLFSVGTFAFCRVFLGRTHAPAPPPPAVSTSPTVGALDGRTPEHAAKTPAVPGDERDSDWLEDLKDPRTRGLARALAVGDREAIDRNIKALLDAARAGQLAAQDPLPAEQQAMLKAWADRRGHSALVRLFSDGHGELLGP